MESFPVCPCCKVIVATSGVQITDKHNVIHTFHDKCNMDVFTGWSGSPLSSGTSMEECLKKNYAVVGIEL
jgi:hypothetical protein